MGLGCDELYSLTPRTFNNQLMGFNQYQEQLMRDRWEQTRMIVHSCIAPHSKKTLKPKEILPFPWDNKSRGRKIIASNEQIAKDVARHKQVLLKLNKE